MAVFSLEVLLRLGADTSEMQNESPFNRGLVLGRSVQLTLNC